MDDAANSYSRLGRWTAAATIASAVLADLWVGPDASLVVTLVFGPFVASALASVRDTVTLALLATSLAIVLALHDGTLGTPAHLARLAGVLAGSALATWLSIQRIAREAKLRTVTRVAEVAQQTILRPLPSVICGIGLQSVTYQPQPTPR